MSIGNPSTQPGLFIFGILAMWAGQSAAASGQSLSACRSIQEAQGRLACYDTIAKAAAAAPKREAITSTGEVVTPTAPTRFEVADPGKLSRAPSSLVNKPSTFRRMHCVYANVNDYRCTSEGRPSIEVRASIVVPPPTQTAVEARCGTLYRKVRKACTGAVRAIPTAVRWESGPVLVVEAPSITLNMRRP